MNRLSGEWEAKLSMLRSIARSQEALARILDSVADVTGSAGPSSAALREHVRVLSNLQAALLGAVTGLTWQPPKIGRPVAPWVAEKAVIRNVLKRQPEVSDWNGA